MSYEPYRALYLHIPFCVSRCAYCDFTTHAIAQDDVRIDEYLEWLITEIRRASHAGHLCEIETAYIGGGTPTYLGHARLTSLLYALSVSVDLSRDGFELSIEANPESLDEQLVKDMWALGVNRLSLGVQSFDDTILHLLGRAHTADDARDAIRAAHPRFENVSIDLICGIPGQSEESFCATLDEALALGVTHISVYPLTIEPHTPLYRAVLEGSFQEPDDDMQASHMKRADEILSGAGFTRYEIASYARPGFECKHNISYWTGVPYKGIGESATTMTQNSERRMRMTDNNVDDDLSREELEAEDIMLGMRLACGVDDERIARAVPYVPKLPQTLDALEEEGYLEHVDKRWRPTEQGWLCGNELFARLIDLADAT